MRCFLSHNAADKEIARSIGAHMMLTGIDVWFDEWEIQAGDSIPGKLNAALAAFDAFVILWSANANKSNWVRQELHTAITQAMATPATKIIPCILDDTPLPPLIADRRWVDLRDRRNGLDELLGDLTGSRTRRLRLRAIQAAMTRWTWNGLHIPPWGRSFAVPSAAKPRRFKAGKIGIAGEATTTPE